MQNFQNKDENGRIILPEVKAEFYKVGIDNGVINFYFNLNGKRYYFKANSKYTLDVSELLSKALSDKVGVDSVEMMPAVYKLDDELLYGVISQDFVKDRSKTETMSGKKLLSMFQQDSEFVEQVFKRQRYNTIEHHIKALKIIKANIEYTAAANLSFKLDRQIPSKLKQQLLYSYIIANQDCHAQNIEYMVYADDKNQKTISLAPLFDNSMSFLIKGHKPGVSENFHSLSKEQQKNQIEERLDEVNFPFQVKQSSCSTNDRVLLSREIAELIANDRKLADLFQRIKSTDKRDIFKQYRQKNNFKFITDEQIEIAALVVEGSVRAIEIALEYERVSQNTPMRLLKPKFDQTHMEF